MLTLLTLPLQFLICLNKYIYYLFLLIFQLQSNQGGGIDKIKVGVLRKDMETLAVTLISFFYEF